MKKKRERENWDWDLGSRGRQGVAGPALMTVTAATSAAAGTNQRPPRADLAPSPYCARGLHSVRAHHTEPRKTCSRVRGICNSAIMKREFVQPCAGQNSEFTQCNKQTHEVDGIMKRFLATVSFFSQMVHETTQGSERKLKFNTKRGSCNV